MTGYKSIQLQYKHKCKTTVANPQIFLRYIFAFIIYMGLTAGSGGCEGVGVGGGD